MATSSFARRRTEANIYAQALVLDLLAEGVGVRGPVKLFGCDPNKGARPPARPTRHSASRAATTTALSKTPAMLQIEKPEECIRLTLEFLGKHGLHRRNATPINTNSRGGHVVPAMM